MTRGEYLAGCAWLLVTLGCAAGATRAIVRARLDHLTGAVRFVASATVASASVVAVHLLPLALGVLTRGTVAACAVVVLLAARRLWLVRGTPATSRDAGPRARSSGLSWALALAAGAFAVVYVIAFYRATYAAAPDDTDSTLFVLPTIAEWVQRGSLWHAHELAPGWSFSSYPHTGNMLQLAVVLPWHADFLVRAVGPLGMLVAGTGAYAAAGELRAPRAAAVSFSVLAVMMTATAVSALDTAHTDVWAATWLMAGALFLGRHARGAGRGELVLAGVALGLAFGTKWYGPLFAAVAGCVWLAARWAPAARQRGSRASPAALREAAALALLVLAVGGLWLVRNLVMLGDPLFPARIAPLGITLFDGAGGGWYDRVGHSITDYAGDWGVLRHAIAPQLWHSFSWAGSLLAGALPVAGALALGRRRSDPSARAVLAVAACGLAVLALYPTLPYTALGEAGRPELVGASARYLTFAFLLAAVAAAWACARVPRAAAACQALALVALVAAASDYATFGSDPRYDVLHPRALATGAAIVGGVAAAAWAATHFARRRVAGGILVTLVVAVVTVVAVDRQSTRYLEARYRGVNPTYDHLIDHAPEGMRVALAGEPSRTENSPQLVMYGPRYGNRVSFLGRSDHGLLQRASDRDGFVRGLSGFDLLLVGGPTRELAWARAAGWTPLAEGGDLTLLAPPAP